VYADLGYDGLNGGRAEKAVEAMERILMFYRRKPESALSKLAGAVSRVDGVIAAVLFGSRAREDQDEYSDYDLLVVFESDEARRENWDRLYEGVSKTGLFTQVLARSLREIEEKTEPTFLREILKHGRVIFLRHPMEAPAAVGSLKPMRIVTYDLKNLSHRDKQRLCYRLFGKRTKRYSYPGAVAELGGARLGDGCIMVPEEEYPKLARILAEHGVAHKAIIAYV
jgi:predicted nucleotidyltransferase